MLYNDFGMRFNSPFINLFIPANHFVEILKNIDDIKKWDIEDITPQWCNYPIGLLNNAWEIHFMHYESYEAAITKWKTRITRMNLDDIYAVLVETASCSNDDLLAFDGINRLNIKKIAITSFTNDNILCSHVIRNYDGKNINGELFYKCGLGKYPYDSINWQGFLQID